MMARMHHEWPKACAMIISSMTDNHVRPLCYSHALSLSNHRQYTRSWVQKSIAPFLHVGFIPFAWLELRWFQFWFDGDAMLINFTMNILTVTVVEDSPCWSIIAIGNPLISDFPHTPCVVSPHGVISYYSIIWLFTNFRNSLIYVYLFINFNF